MPLQRRDLDGIEPGQPNSFSLSEETVQAQSSRIVFLEAELSQMRDHWMRAEAETANVRTRAKRDVDETRQYAIQTFATEVAGAADNLRRRLHSLPAPSPSEPELVTRLRDGLVGMERSFVGVLERNNTKQEDPTGSAFDPDRHQTMAEQVDHSRPPGTVLQAWTPAWTLNGRLLRPAMVVVAKAPAPQAVRPNGHPVQATA